MSEINLVGISALLNINGSTKAVRGMLADVPKVGWQIKDTTDLHMMLVDPFEAAVDVYSAKDQEVLDGVEADIQNYLGGLSLRELVLRPAEATFRKYCTSLAVKIDRTPEIDEIRETLGDFVEKAGITLGENYKPHISVAKARRDAPRNPKADKPKIAQNIHVTGYEAQQSMLSYDYCQKRRPGLYVNVPSSLRQ